MATLRDPTAGAAAPAAPARESLEAYRSVVRDSTRLNRLLEVLSQPGSTETVLDRALLTLSELFAADVVVLLDAPGSGRLASLCAIGLPDDQRLPPLADTTRGPAAEAARRLTPVVVSGGDAAGLGGTLHALGVVEALFLPALGALEVEAVLLVARCHPVPFPQADVDLLGAMAQRIGLLLGRSRAAEARRRLEVSAVQAQKAESLGRMAGAIAHRFNNLLGAASGFLELAALDVPAGGEAQADLALALQAVREAAQVSGLMLTYLGQGSPAREPVDLSAVCRTAVEVLRSTLPPRVRLRVELPAGPMAVRGEASGLHALVSSLVINAWESLPEAGGEITVSLRPAAKEELSAGLLVPPGWRPAAASHACLEVRDEGCGMDALALRDAFDPFFTTKFAGRGMGLPVALGTARAHGGAIAAESAPGQGSRFRVFLPLPEEAACRSAPPRERAVAPARGLALVADDEPSMRRALEQLLRRMGYQVVVAADGLEAVELFRQHEAAVRLVVLDLTMPRLDGWQALAAVRATAGDVPVILASGYDEASVMGGASPDDPPAFLQKPFTLDELEDAIARASRPRAP